jgi:hypothetical protein
MTNGDLLQPDVVIHPFGPFECRTSELNINNCYVWEYARKEADFISVENTIVWPPVRSRLHHILLCQ